MIFLRCLVIISVNLLLYWRTLSFGYVSDDETIAKHTEPVPKNKWETFYYLLTGQRYFNPRHAHILTFSLHIINTLLIYVCLGLNDVSFLASLLFSINPVNMQGGAVWISSKGYSTATSFALLMYGLPFYAPVTFFWAVWLNKTLVAPSIWFAPLVFYRTPYWYLMLMTPIALMLPITRKVLDRKMHSQAVKTYNSEMVAVKFDKIFPFVKTYGYYFRLCLFPWKIGLYHDFLYGQGTNKTDNDISYRLNWDFRLGLMLIVFTAVCCLFFWSPFAFGLLWFSVNIAMWCNFTTIQQQVAERFTYLANVGMMYALAYLILNIGKLFKI